MTNGESRLKGVLTTYFQGKLRACNLLEVVLAENFLSLQEKC